MRLTPISTALLGVSLFGGGVIVRAAAPERPNVVVILADDLGYRDLSSYGAPDIKTPAIDSIGRQGVKFTRFYSNAPECTPSRAALLTGRHPQRIGGLECAIGLGNVGRYDEAEWLQKRGELGLPSSEVTIGELFRRAGYDTALVGKWHLGYEPKFSPTKHGFGEVLTILGGGADYVSHTEPDGRKVMFHNDRPVEKPGHLTDIFADHALAWLQRPRDKPYLLYLPFNAPHDPYQGPGDGPMTGPWSRGTRTTYVRMVEHLDRRVGDILKWIDASPGGRNTIVVFLSDNGGTQTVADNKPLRGHKTTLWEGGIRVPCLVRWPGTIPAGTESNQVAQSIDLTATLLAAAHIRPADGRPLDGVNLLDVWRGESPTFARTLFWRYKRGPNRRIAILDGDYKLTIDNGKKELLNLASDPVEKTNLLATHTAKAAELEARLATWEVEVSAPRLREFSASSTSAATEGSSSRD